MSIFAAARDRRGTPADLLVVGLGNPGSEYVGTRHNVGVEVLELLAARWGGRLKLRPKEKATVAEVKVDGRLLVLAFPQTYMNLSGESVGPLVKRYGVSDPNHIVVVHDELDLDVGRLKIKSGGGLAGHNGLKSIKQHLRTADFLRIRLGVGKPPHSGAGKSYVLRPPAKAEQIEFDIMVQEAADAVELLLDKGVERAMNRYNQ